MALNAMLETLDGLDPKIAAEYVEIEINGQTRFKLDIAGMNDHPDVGALRRAHNRTKEELRTAKEDKQALEDRVEGLPDDFDGDAYTQLKAKADGQSAGKPEEEIRAEATAAANKAADAKWQKKLTPLEQERDTLRTQLDSRLKREALDEALDRVRVTDPAYRKAARALLGPQLVIKDVDGEPVALASHPDFGDIPVAEHVTTWAGSDEGKRFVAPSDAEGGGSDGQSRRRDPDTSSNPWKAGTGFNVTKQAQVLRDNPGLATKLKREAGIG